MSRYIRTKDGIYKLIEIRKNEYRMLNADGTVHLAHYESEDYKITDTIEELCDEFVAIHQTNKNTNYITRAPLKSLYEIEYKKFNRIVYGAIWTDKGLIYVAKMNQEGELELI